MKTSGEAGEFEVLNVNAALTLAKIVCFKVVIKIFLFLFFAVFFLTGLFQSPVESTTAFGCADTATGLLVEWV